MGWYPLPPHHTFVISKGRGATFSSEFFPKSVFNFEACELLVFRRLLKGFYFGAQRPRFQLLQVVRKLQYKVPAVQRPDLFLCNHVKYGRDDCAILSTPAPATAPQKAVIVVNPPPRQTTKAFQNVSIRHVSRLTESMLYAFTFRPPPYLCTYAPEKPFPFRSFPCHW